MGEKHDILYLVGYNPRDTNGLGKLRDLLEIQSGKANVGLVLIQDGVIGLSTRGKAPAFTKDLSRPSLKVYAMIPDFKARGIPLDSIRKDVQGIEYGDLVDLMVNATKVVSWL